MTTILTKGKNRRKSSTRWIDSLIFCLPKTDQVITCDRQSERSESVYLLANRKAQIRARLVKMKNQVHIVLEGLEELEESSKALAPKWIILRDEKLKLDCQLIPILAEHLLVPTRYSANLQVRRPLFSRPGPEDQIYGGKVVAYEQEGDSCVVQFDYGLIQNLTTQKPPTIGQYVVMTDSENFVYLSEWDAKIHYREV